MLLRATDRPLGLVGRFAKCFTDGRVPGLTEHPVTTLVGQRIFALTLGYEDLVDHDRLRHDPTIAVLAANWRRRKDCAPLAGKSTLNRLELGGAEQTRYHRIAWDAAKIEAARHRVSGPPSAASRRLIPPIKPNASSAQTGKAVSLVRLEPG